MSLLSLQVGSVASGYCNRQVDIAIGIHTYVVAKVTFVMCHRVWCTCFLN